MNVNAVAKLHNAKPLYLTFLDSLLDSKYLTGKNIDSYDHSNRK